MSKLSQAIPIALLILAIVSLLIALSVSGKFTNNPKVPDPSTGHTIAFTARGLGTVYLTQNEWDSVAPYWHAFYASLGAFIAFVVASFIYVTWRSFIKEWRRPDQ